MPAYYPVFLDVRGRRCVVFGGGDVGEEKAGRLVEYGADTVVISSEVHGSVREIADRGGLTWISRGYLPGDLEGAFIAIVADTSDGAVNEAVSREALERNVPLNVADVTSLCTWIAPAVVRRGEVIVATSTGGTSPALARKFREELAGTSRTGSRHPVMEYADLAPLLSSVRSELQRKGVRLTPDHWQACLTDDLVDMLRAGRADEARLTLMASLMTGADCDCRNGACKMWESMAIQGLIRPTKGASSK